MPNITSVTVIFGNGIKREEYGPVKKAEVSITVAVAEGENGEAVLDQSGRLAIAKVAEMLDAPKPTPAVNEGAPVAGEPPARRTRGRPKKEEAETPVEQEPATSAETPEAVPTEESTPAAAATEDEWASGPADIEITDQEILSATSKRAQELGAREPIIKLIATFSTRGSEGPPFKVQEIPQAQRKDYLAKLAALTV